MALLSALYSFGLPAVYAWRFPLIAPVYFFVGDAFYYLDIARHAVAHQGFSFDGEFVTNGFHPLWEWVLTALGLLKLVPFNSPARTLSSEFWLDALLLSVASGLLSAFAARLLKRPMLALLVASPGLLWFATGIINTQFIATWTYLNGMESALAMLFFALALCFSKPEMSLRRGLLVALLLGFAVLSRLDDALIALPMLAVLPVRGKQQKILASLPAAGILLAYLAYNKATVGAMLPLSGAAKASLAVSYNLRWLLALFLPVFTGDLPSVLYLVAHPFYGFGERAARMMQMLAPALVCVIELTSLARRRRQRELPCELLLVAGAAAGVCLKALYNFFFVLAWAQGQWYYAVSVAVANLILVLWVDRALTRSAFSKQPGKAIRWLAAHALLVLLSFNISISRRNTEGAASDVVLLRDSSPLIEELRKLGTDRIIEYDDGFISFVAQRPALAGLGLALDASAARALPGGRIPQYGLPKGLPRRRGTRRLHRWSRGCSPGPAEVERSSFCFFAAS